jgi:2-dehydro-3-deoxyphosphogluconate aldolase/(4S)-4-hydroxy-2-oxoglutarate aldolase
MSTDKVILHKIKEQGVLPLYFHPDPSVCLSVLEALYAAGIRVIEFTNRGEQALQNFVRLRQAKEQTMKDLVIGIGTIKTAEQARQFVAEGADFLISPGWVPEVAEVAVLHSQFYVPGCMTPTEIISAENHGATFIKLFPGHLLGPGFVSAITELFPRTAFMPTGGVEPERANLEAWFKSGVVGVGMGSKLISPAVLAAKDYGKITELTVKVLGLIKEIRG